MDLSPIGHFRTEMQLKFDSPHQPASTGAGRNFIELQKGLGLERAVKDLEGFERIWIISWFHLNTTWRPMVLPPRGKAKRRGLFATRSPHRPNPIGLTSVPLLAVKGLTLEVGPCDLVDGTPILDLKPYIPTNDAFPEAKFGWVEELEREYASGPSYEIKSSEIATQQLSWLQNEWNIDFMPRARDILSRDPHPHRTRRIKQVRPGVYRMGCGAWRLYYSILDRSVMIESIDCGYPLRTLTDMTLDHVPFREAQLAFLEKWPYPTLS